MEYVMKLNLRVRSYEEDWLNSLYSAKPSINDVIELSENMHLTYESTSFISRGFGTTDFIIALVIDIGVNVAIDIISNIIYEKIMNHGKNKLIIIEEKLIIITKDELIVYIKKSISE
jgi:hypothetical protein